MAANNREHDKETAHATFSSPPCYMHEIDPAYTGLIIDARQARDVARWRPARRDARTK